MANRRTGEHAVTKIPDGAQVISVAAADMTEGEVRRAASDMLPKVLANPERYQEAVIILARSLYYLAQEHGRRIRADMERDI